MKYLICDVAAKLETLIGSDVLRVKTVDGAAVLVWSSASAADVKLKTYGLCESMKVIELSDEKLILFMQELTRAHFGWSFVENS